MSAVFIFVGTRGGNFYRLEDGSFCLDAHTGEYEVRGTIGLWHEVTVDVLDLAREKLGDEIGPFRLTIELLDG